MPGRITATVDPALRARIVARRPLVYDQPAAPQDDRADFARAASGLAWLGDTLAIIQDDAAFVALLAPDGRLRSAMLPAGPGGRRRFESRLGNKADKLDLEACIALPGAMGPRLVAFGSGLMRPREVVVVVEPVLGPVLERILEPGVAPGDDRIRVVDAPDLHGHIRAALGPDPVNLEGACVQGDRVRLFQRGNGAAANLDRPAEAALDFELPAFVAWLDTGALAPPVHDVTWYDLGAIKSIRYGFSDVHAIDAIRAIFVAAAEASPDAIEDGLVHGTRIGLLDGAGARVTSLLAEDGSPAAVKAEGIVLARDRRDHALIVLDPDDPDQPAELCTVQLAGPW